MLEIELPVDFIADLSAQATEIVADLAPVWILVSGILVGLGIVAFVVEMFLDARGGKPATQQAPAPQQTQPADAEDMDNEMP